MRRINTRVASHSHGDAYLPKIKLTRTLKQPTGLTHTHKKKTRRNRAGVSPAGRGNASPPRAREPSARMPYPLARGMRRKSFIDQESPRRRRSLAAINCAAAQPTAARARQSCQLGHTSHSGRLEPPAFGRQLAAGPRCGHTRKLVVPQGVLPTRTTSRTTRYSRRTRSACPPSSERILS